MKWVLAFVLLVLAGAPPSGVDHSPLDAILGDVVRGEDVDYVRIRERHLDRLVAYLDDLDRQEPAALPPDERLALLINVYNATMLRVVAERYEPGYSPSRGLFRVFDEPLVALGGRRLSLNELEHELIRKRFDEPRIHAALVCAARSCPPLLPRAYRGEDLPATLEANMRRFVNDPARNRIDVAGRRLELSRIFKWYADDFGGRDKLAAYVDRYTEADVSSFDVSFLTYSWELNEPR